MKKLNGLMAVAMTALASSAVQAGPVVEWGYAVTSSWVGASFTDGGGTQTVIANEISWGDPTGNLGTAPNGGRSGLVITNTSPPSLDDGGLLTDHPNAAPTSIITHSNNPISGGFATLLTAELNTTLDLKPINPAGEEFTLPSLTFNIDFRETTNSTPCGFPVGSVCDDIFVIAFGALDNSFNYDGYKYFVSIVTTTGNITPLDPLTCAAAEKLPGCLGFQTTESNATPVEFGIRITSTPLLVSEPGALALAGLGLLGLGLSRRRKAAA